MASPRERELTITEAAELKGVSTKTVRRWIASGALPAYRYSAQIVRIRPADLDRVGRRIPSGRRSA